MNTNDMISKIKEVLNLSEEVKLEQQALENGTVLEAEAFESGNEVFIVTEDEKVAVPGGEYQLEDGRILVVAEEGLISEIKTEEAEEEAPAEEVEVEAAEEEKEEILTEEPTLNNNTLSIVMDVLRMDEEQLQSQLNNNTVDLSTESLMNESLAMGSLNSFLSSDIPDYSNLNVQQDVRPQTQRASQSINSMSSNDVGDLLDSFTENMQESGGFGDQTVALLLMNGISNINDYYNQQLPLQPQFYINREIYRINLPDARMSVLRMNYNSSQIYDELVGQQYGRN